MRKAAPAIKFINVTDATVERVSDQLNKMSIPQCLSCLQKMDRNSLDYLSCYKDRRGITLLKSMLMTMTSEVDKVHQVMKLLEPTVGDQYNELITHLPPTGYGDYSIFELLFSRTWRVSDEDRSAMIAALDYVLSKTNQLETSPNPFMQDPLYEAVREADIEVTELLLKKGFKILPVDNKGFTLDDYAMYDDPQTATEQTPVRNFYTSYLAIKNSLSLESQAVPPRNKIRI